MTTYSVDNYDELRIQGAGVPVANNDVLAGNGWLSKARGLMYSSAGFQTTTITTITTPTKVANTTNSSHLLNFTHSTGRLTYTASGSRKVLVNASLCGISSTVNAVDIRMFIFKNGSTESGNRTCSHFNSSTGTEIGVSVNTIHDLATNDYLEIFISNQTNTDDLDINLVNMTITDT